MALLGGEVQSVSFRKKTWLDKILLQRLLHYNRIYVLWYFYECLLLIK
jgi:hypothetical protein